MHCIAEFVFAMSRVWLPDRHAVHARTTEGSAQTVAQTGPCHNLQLVLHVCNNTTPPPHCPSTLAIIMFILWLSQMHVLLVQDLTLPHNITATTSMAEAIAGARFAIHALPVQHSRAFLTAIKVVLCYLPAPVH